MRIQALVASAAFIFALVAGSLPRAEAAPKDHCIPRSACKCEWMIVDGKQQYVCTVIKVPK